MLYKSYFYIKDQEEIKKHCSDTKTKCFHAIATLLFLKLLYYLYNLVHKNVCLKLALRKRLFLFIVIHPLVSQRNELVQHLAL